MPAKSGKPISNPQSDPKGPAGILPRETIAAIVDGQHGDPFAVLGLHRNRGVTLVRAYIPGALAVEVLTRAGEPVTRLARRHDAGFFEGRIGEPMPYLLRAANESATWVVDDPYAYGAVLGEIDDWLLGEGTHVRLYDRLGAHPVTHEGVAGVHFAVWAPNAARVSVVGDFNAWDGRRYVMRRRHDTGVWEIFVPGIGEGALYKYEVLGPARDLLPLKADPLGFAAELRPYTASIVCDTTHFPWTDGAWMQRRAATDARRQPLSIYEVHLASWRRADGNRWLTYDELAETLVPYAAQMGFTHLELLPVTEHPLDESWGYQPIGLFAPTSRHGDPAAFARFVDRAHAAGIGVILDWVPAHFPTDPHGLAWFDGTALYEHADPRQGFHPDWNTAVFQYGRPEVANYLMASALYWLDRYHLDGLRVDAVASMLYLDYSRKEGEWVPNRHGGNENLEAIAFLRRLNTVVRAEHPGAITIAEESTAWPGVSQAVEAGGLGFGFKWNMGWMNDTLEYLRQEPIHRQWHHDRATFGLVYAFSESFVLPLSHDEVVHGKGSLIAKLPGDGWQQFATLRAALAMMWAYPGKKLLFMGQEFGQGQEWNFRQSLDWHLLEIGWHRGTQALVRNCNEAYRAHPALHRNDCEDAGFGWAVVDDREQSVFAWLRYGDDGDAPVAVIVNFTPVARGAYRIGLPRAGRWREIVNTDAASYGGTNCGNGGEVLATATAHGDFPASALLTVPPLGAIWLVHDGNQ